MGLATSTSKTSMDDLVGRANNALQCAKKEGRNCYKVYDNAINIFLKRDAEIEKDLYSVVNSDQLFLEYQPIVGLNGKLVGCEALIRWHHPRYGYLSPKDFISISERTNSICDIGSWCLDMAGAYIKKLNTQIKKDFYISVNLSPRQIFHTDVAEIIKGILSKYSLDPRWLEIEVTESLVIQDPSQCKRVLDKINALGTKVVLDDFGTGYSSLSYLSHFPFKKFKIDQSFINDLESSQNAYKMIDSIIRMGKSLNMDITIEGVETEGQYNILKQFLCDYLQGYYFAKPMPESDFTKLARNYSFLKK